MSEAKAIKRHAAQYDLFNRLHSIAADQRFVKQVEEEWFDGRFEVVRELNFEFSQLKSSEPEMW